MNTIGALPLPDDLVWVNEFSTTQIAQSKKRTLTGVNVIQESTLIHGRNIILDGLGGSWITRAELLALRALAESEDVSHVLRFNNVNYDVRFDRSSGSAIEATPVVNCSDPTSDHNYSIKLSFFTAAS
jgi:hypothetical protein